MINYRKTTLTTIDTLIAKTHSITPSLSTPRLTKLIHFLTINLELLKNDIILILNQNFYLRCKLQQGGSEREALERRLKEQMSHMQLSVEMLKLKHEKHIQHLKFNHFYHGHKVQSGNLPKSILDQFKTLLVHQDIQSYKKQQNKQQNQIANTVKKHREIKEYKIPALPKDILDKELKEKWHQKDTSKDVPHQFDLVFRGGLVSQEQTMMTNNKISQQLMYSQESPAKKKKVRQGHPKKQENVVQQHRKKKSEQLADLVAQQFKVNRLKQQYFSTDLL